MVKFAPDFMHTEYYDAEKCCMKPNAPDNLKREYEKYFNGGNMESILRVDYPELKHPYITWEYKIVENPRKAGKK